MPKPTIQTKIIILATIALLCMAGYVGFRVLTQKNVQLEDTLEQATSSAPVLSEEEGVLAEFKSLPSSSSTTTDSKVLEQELEQLRTPTAENASTTADLLQQLNTFAP